MFFLLLWVIKAYVKMILLIALMAAWITCAMFVAPVALVVSLAGHQRAAQEWMKSLYWHRAFKAIL